MLLYGLIATTFPFLIPKKLYMGACAPSPIELPAGIESHWLMAYHQPSSWNPQNHLMTCKAKTKISMSIASCSFT